MNRRAHVQVGTTVSVGICFYNQLQDNKTLDLIEVGIAAIGGGLGGVLPDMLEPAYSPNHREIAHSLTTLVVDIIAVGTSDTWTANLHPYFATFLKAILVGYASHLVMDAFTPKSLPILGARV